jgi:hypothetical protein
MRNALKYGAGLIALYLIVYNGSRSGTVFREGAKGVGGVVKSFQGR